MANNRYVILQNQASFKSDTYAAFGSGSKAHVIDQISEDINEEHGFVYKNTASTRIPRNRMSGPRISGGEIGVPLYTLGTPTLMYYALGNVLSTTNFAGPPINYKHVITPAGTIPSFQMGIGKDLKEHRFVGCAVKSMALDYSVDEVALGTFDLLVRKELDPGALQTLTLPDYGDKEKSFLGVEVTGKIDTTAIDYIRSFNVTIDNNLVDDSFVFGNRFLPLLRTQGLTITGSLSLLYDDITRYTDALNENAVALELTFATGTKASTGYRELTVKLPRLSFDSVKLPTDANNEYVVDLSFTAETTPTESNPITIEVYNNEIGSGLKS